MSNKLGGSSNEEAHDGVGHVAVPAGGFPGGHCDTNAPLCAHVRRPLVSSFEASTGSTVRPLAAILDLAAFLIYVGFAAAKVPFGIVGPVGPQDIEQTLDTIGLFALLVAVVQLATPLIIHRVANNLEPWPPPREEEPSSA